MEFCSYCWRDTKTVVWEGNDPLGGMAATPVCSVCGWCRCPSCEVKYDVPNE